MERKRTHDLVNDAVAHSINNVTAYSFVNILSFLNAFLDKSLDLLKASIDDRSQLIPNAKNAYDFLEAIRIDRDVPLPQGYAQGYEQEQEQEEDLFFAPEP